MTTSGSARAATSCGRAAYGAALTTTRAAAAVRAAGGSGDDRHGHLELDQQDVARPEVVETGSRSSRVSSALAPGMTTMAFSLSASTVIQAWPVAAPGTTRTAETSMPRARRRAR